MTADMPATLDAMDVEPLIRAEHISFAYGKAPDTLVDVSMSVRRNEILTLLGPNGSGKSTLLNCLIGLLEPQSGSIFIDGKNIKQMQPRQVASKIAYVKQSHAGVFAFLVRDYVAMGRATHMGMFTRPTKDDFLKAERALELMGVQNLANRAYTELSGGQRQLCDICRAIVQEPELILFDEPTSALDYGNQLRVLELVKQLAEEGFGVVLTTHNPDHAILLGGNAAVLSREGKIECGPSDCLISEERLSKLYGARLRIVDVPEAGRKVCIAPGMSDSERNKHGQLA